MTADRNVWPKMLLAIFILIAVSSAHGTDPQIRLGYSDAEAFPFQIRHDADPPGIAMEIIERVGKDLGIRVVFIRLPNKRVQHSLLGGQEIDGAFMYSYKTDREINGQYPMKDGRPDEDKRIATLSYYIYKLKESPLQWDGEKFSGVESSHEKIKIGANTGYSIVGDLGKMSVAVDEGSKTSDQNFKKLLMGRISGYAHQNLVADNYIKTNNLTTVEKLPIPLSTKPYFLMFSHNFMKKNPQLAEKFWSRIAEIRDTVTNEVMQKYSD